jgi:hypothetical protein
VYVTIRVRNTFPAWWNVETPEDHSLGIITEAAGFGFLIHHLRGTRLAGVGLGPYATLGDAMRRIGAFMKALCVLSSD